MHKKVIIFVLVHENNTASNPLSVLDGYSVFADISKFKKSLKIILFERAFPAA